MRGRMSPPAEYRRLLRPPPATSPWRRTVVGGGSRSRGTAALSENDPRPPDGRAKTYGECVASREDGVESGERVSVAGTAFASAAEVSFIALSRKSRTLR